MHIVLFFQTQFSSTDNIAWIIRIGWYIQLIIGIISIQIHGS